MRIPKNIGRTSGFDEGGSLMKKFISAVLCFALICSFMCPAFALDSSSNIPGVIPDVEERAPLEDVLESVREEFPSAAVSVDSGVINVYIENSSSTFASYNLQDSKGGCWREFKPPFGTSTMSTIPYACIYLPKDEAAATYYGLTKTNLVDIILGLAAKGMKNDKISAEVLKKFGINIKPAGIALLILYGQYKFISTLDLASYKSAYQGGNPVRMMLATNQGWPLNVYSKWDGINVNPDPYSSWKPTWHSGEYYYK